MMMTPLRQDRRIHSNRGFTLVEMLVVISILILLLTMTALTVNFARDDERVTGGARKVQSFIAGARDRAIFRGTPIGVRLFLDSEDDPNAGVGERRTVSSMTYIDPGQTWTDGAIQLERWDPDHDGATNFPGTNPDINGDGILDSTTLIWMVAGLKANKWWELKRRGMLVDGTRIRIPAGRQGTWYPVDTRFIDLTSPPADTQYLVLGIPYADRGSTPEREAVAFNAPAGPQTYELELPASIMPSEPALLPDSVVIDLDGSKLPIGWRPSAQNGSNFSPFMDIIFSPRGNVIGQAASSGLIHLYVCDKSDATTLKSEFISSVGSIGTTPFIPAAEIDPANAGMSWVSSLAEAGEPYLVKTRRIVSIFSQTGAITMHQVDPTDVLPGTGPDGIADDPYLFAETGEEAN